MADEQQLRDYLRRVTIELTEERARRHEPIAIVGMACRFPGGVASPAQLWQLLSDGGDGIGAMPADRGWDADALYDPDPDLPGSMYVRESGFLEEAGAFDAEFFGIGPREATAIDPQHRLLLEASWEALEDAAIVPADLHGSQAGVFTGLMHHGHGVGVGPSRSDLEGHLSTGAASGAASGRIAYALGLEGPALTVDTACSSSLVALHLAVGALRDGSCSLALAGGATVMWTPDVLLFFSRQRGLALDARCKSFAEGADGTVLSEGAGVLVLERLSDAEAKGHRVLATIKGSAVNQDGASNGLTAPNGPAQERVIRAALANAGLEPGEIDMVEAHGTGTALGDPIEAGALLATYGQERERPLKLGSLKSNIGHAQAAAGVAGVIKAVMALRAGTMPKTLHVERPSTAVDWEAGEVELLTEASPWPERERPRRAAVSSFGISGTNAHLILEEASVVGRDPGPGASAKDQDREEGIAPAPIAGPLPFLLAAKSPPALAAQAAGLAARLRDDPGLGLADLSFSLATTRAQLEQRAVVVSAERDHLLAGLGALARGEQPSGTVADRARPGARLAYLFTGQGSQRPGMGAELYRAYPAYAEAFDRACAAIDAEMGSSLRELVFCEPGSPQAELLEHTAYAQPALFATEVALYRLLESCGMTPELLCGHSVGEIVAAHVSGVLSLADAAKLISARGALMGALPPGGAMLAIEATEAEALALVAGKEDELSLAAVNAPGACVISGVEEAIASAEAGWREEGRKAKRLAVSHAFHSPLIEPMLAEFEQLARGLSYAEPQLPIVSCLSGELLSAERAGDPAHWVAHAREPVRFAAAVDSLRAEGAGVLLELGPDPVLCAMARECLGEESRLALVPALREGREEGETLIGALAQAHAAGAPIEWSAFFAGSGAKAVPLPTYPFQRQRYWLAPKSANADPTAIGQEALDHPFLAAAIEDPEGEGIAFSGRICLEQHPWLADHAVLASALLPATAFLELALSAGEQAGAPLVEELTLEAPLLLLESAVQLRVSITAPTDEQGRREIAIHSRPEGEAAPWTRNASGVLSSASPDLADPLPEWPPKGAEPIELADLRARLEQAGFEYGPAFAGLDAAWSDGADVYAEVSLPSEAAGGAGRFALHPALLDAALHPLALGAGEAARLPFAWSGVRLSVAGVSSLRVRARTAQDRLSLSAVDRNGLPVLGVESVIARPVDRAKLSAAAGGQRSLYRLAWQPFSAAAAAAESGSEPLVEDFRSPAAGDPAEAARSFASRALERLQKILAAAEGEDSRAVFLTASAVVARQGDSPDPAAAAIGGLARSAASEHPGRFVLIDTDGSEASEAALPKALAAGASEPQLALRDGELLVPRLAPIAAEQGDPAVLDPERTVLITGATGGLGALIARHLVEAHDARHLLLASRSGEWARGAPDLGAELAELGAEVELRACDVSDRARLQELLGSIPAEHPLGAVIHCAGVLEDATVETASAAQLGRVFAPKVDAAWRLHELTKEIELSHFVLFSSLAGIVGAAGQGAYAAANSFLDALAAQRRAQGLAGGSIAWGPWEQEAGMVAELDPGRRARFDRAGLAPLSREQGLALFDAALALPEAAPVAVQFETARLRAQAEAGLLPKVLQGLAPARRRGERPSDSLLQRLAGVPAEEREDAVLDFVRAHVAAVLGHDSAAGVDPARAFKELGFDSLAAVELRNRLTHASGLRLPSTLVFDYPTPAALSGYLLAEVGVGEPDDGASEEESFRQELARLPLSRLREAGLLKPLRDLINADGEQRAGEASIGEIDAMQIEDLVRRTVEDHSLETGAGGR